MYDTSKVITGIIIFILLFTSPLWINLSSGKASKKPVLIYPKDYANCVRSKEYMNAYHMDLLNQWRDSVVRLNVRFTSFQDKNIEMSLTKTCLKCHSSKEDFCDQCHNYLNVNPYCWDCHVELDKFKIEDLMQPNIKDIQTIKQVEEIKIETPIQVKGKKK